MRSFVSCTLGMVAAVQLAVAVPTAGAQASGPNACAFIDAAELKKLTGRTDVLGTGPERSAPEALPKHMSQCTYLNFTFALTTNMNAEAFAKTRQNQTANTNRWKLQPISGLGDEAYYMWDGRPGSYRSVGVVFRKGTQQIALGDLVSSEEVESLKQVLLTVAKAIAARMR